MISFVIVLERAGGGLWVFNDTLSGCDPYGNILVLRLNDIGHICLIDHIALIV